MHCMLMDLLHGFEVLSTTEETLFHAFLFACDAKDCIFLGTKCNITV